MLIDVIFRKCNNVDEYRNPTYYHLSPNFSLKDFQLYEGVRYGTVSRFVNRQKNITDLDRVPTLYFDSSHTDVMKISEPKTWLDMFDQYIGRVERDIQPTIMLVKTSENKFSRQRNENTERFLETIGCDRNARNENKAFGKKYRKTFCELLGLLQATLHRHGIIISAVESLSGQNDNKMKHQENKERSWAK